MFEFFRTHSRLMLGIVVLVIFPSFVVFGIQGYTRFTDGSNATVAKVDGQSITRADWDAAHRRNVERLRRQMPDADTRLLESAAMRRETLEQLVRERVLLATANKLHLQPDDERLLRLFRGDPQFAGIRNPDGSVNKDLLASQGLSSDMFAVQLRQEFAMNQVLGSVQQTAFAPAGAAAPSFDAWLQRREVQVQRFEPAAYRAKLNPTEADLEAYYKGHESEFRAAEQATIEYVVLTLEALAKDVTVPEEDLRKYYTENASRYTVAEERRASHILVKGEPDKAAAEKKAEELLAQVRKAPGTFADVARKNSDDPGSAQRGGDLDFFGRGMMTKPFEDAVFAMKPGEISNVVETDFGFHIISLTSVRGGDKKPFEQVRGEIEAEVRKQLAQKKYAESAELFTNTVYEQSDSLQPVIDKLKLTKQTATVRRQPQPGATGALASVKLLEAVFGNDAVRNKRNTEAVEVGPSQLASARVVTHEPARTLPLAEVKDLVRERVLAEQAAAAAKAEGAKRLAEVQKAPAESIGSTLTVSRVNDQGVPRAVLDAVLKADAAKLPAVVGVDLGEQGYAVARVTQVLTREQLPGGEAMLQQQYARAWADAEGAAVMSTLKKRFKAEIKEAEVAAAAAAASAATP